MRSEGNSAAADSIPRLRLAQLTAKIGAGFRQYPRAGGVLVPRALADLAPTLRDAREISASEDERLALGRAVVVEVAKVMRRLPAAVLAVPLPSPSHVVERTSIEHRTRNVVERLIPFEAGRAWTVARYLQVPGFGARCLTDVLAAHEESAQPPDGAPPTAAAEALGSPSVPLFNVARRLRAVLPLTGTELRALYPDETFARATDPLRALARACAAAGVAAPFRLVRRGGSTIAVAPGSAGLARAACEEAARQVAAWGVADVADVASRVECLSESAVGETIVRRVLVALPRLRWLDPRMRFFSFVNERSPLGKTVERLFAEREVVPLDQLLTTLAEGSAAARRTPGPVLARYLAEIAGCVVVEGEVRRGTG